MDQALLLEHLDWVRALARKLVDDEQVADDLVQDAWLAAEKTPPRDPRAVRAWFSRVVRNLAIQRGQSEASRRAREERVARPEAAWSDELLHGQVATEQSLVAHVMALGEPYRRTLLLRYFQDLGPTEIARQEGVSVGTVKSRLTRAHAKLRAKLDAAAGGDRNTWLMGLIPIALKSKTRSAAVNSAWGGLASLKLWSLVALSLVAFCVGWRALIPADPAGDPTASAAAASPGPAGAADARIEDLLAAGSTRREELAHDAGEVLAAQDDEAPAAPDDLFVRAVSADTQRPLEGVTVRILERHAVDELRLLGLDPRRDSTEMFERGGSTDLTTAAGIARFPWNGQATLIEALSDGRWGVGLVDPERPGEHTVELYRDATLFVEVRDKAGEAASGVPLCIGSSSYGGLCQVASTGSDGLARFPHAGAIVRLSRNLVSGVRLAYPGAPEQLQPIPLDAAGELSSARLKMSLPPTGRVQVTAPAQGAAMRAVAIAKAGEASREDVTQLATPFDQGRAEFAYVGLDLALELIVLLEDGEVAITPFAGPRDAGEVVSVQLDSAGRAAGQRARAGLLDDAVASPFLPDFPIVVGRLVRADGTPLADCDLRTSLRHGPFLPALNRAKSDADGGFRLPISAGRTDSPVSTLEIEVHEDGVGGVVRVDLPSVPNGATHDLGDLIVESRDLIASGVVVDADESPVPNILVTLEVPDVFRRSLGEPGSSGWGHIYDRPSTKPDVRSDEHGRFTLYGELPKEANSGMLSLLGRRGEVPELRLRLRAAGGGRMSNPLPIERGAAGVRLSVYRTASVSASMMRPEAWDNYELSAWLVPRGSDEDTANPIKAGVGGGQMMWLDVVPGAYDLRVGSVADSEQRDLVTDLKITEDGCDDPRLYALDPATFISMHSLKLSDLAGGPVAGRTIRILDRGEGQRRHRTVRTGAEGRVAVPVWRDTARRVAIELPGGMQKSYEMTGDLEVEIPEPLELKVRLVSDDSLIGRGTRISVAALPEDGTFAERSQPAGTGGSDGLATLTVPGSGTYRLVWVLASRAGSSHSFELEGAPSIEDVFDVRSPGQVIELAVSAEVLSAARASVLFAPREGR